jgi:type IV fimbrial biogenesis protein FimT
MQARQISHSARRNTGFGRTLRVSRGFTIIELMVVVAIVATLAALAAPSFTPLMERWRVRQTVDGLQSALYFTRSEAIKRGGNVTIRKEPTGTNGCTLASGAADWDCGWVVFVDTNNDGTLDAGEEVLQRYATSPRTQVTRSSTAADIRFDRWGRSTAPFGFALVPEGKSTSNPAARGLCMSSGGRIRVTTDPADIPCTG